MATEATGGGLEFKPMEQFEVKALFGETVAWYTPTNVTLWLFLTALAAISLLVLGSRGRAIVPSRAQSVAELTYGLVHKMIEDIAGKEGLRYFPYILTLFLFVAFANLLGLVPMAFTVTSHIAVTGILAMAVFVGVTAIGFIKNGAHFLDLFWVRSAPLAVRPILAVIGLLIFIGTYSEFVLARVMLTRVENYTLAVGLSLFISDQFANRWGVFAAGALIGAVPIVVIFLALQRYLVGGLTAGSVKG